ncbi:MAG: serine/threonine-protein kinase [Pseudonocardiales bacterium]
MSIPTSTPGRTIGGRYALQSTIGAGGMGTVWRAFDVVLRREVAVKEVLLPPGVPPAERVMLCERTLREAKAAASLNVASVVTIYDVVEEDDRPWIVMELLEARSLAEIIRTDGPLPPEAVADVGVQVIGALSAAHRAGILHRDVKPGNILVAAGGRATLTDFGVARTTGDSALTSTGLLLGSPCYISPERARGREPGPASDLWSLGATLFAAVEGHPPYDLGDPLPTLTAIVTDPPAPFHRAGPLTEVLTGLLEKDPDLRWDADRAAAALRAAEPSALAPELVSADHETVGAATLRIPVPMALAVTPQRAAEQAAAQQLTSRARSGARRPQPTRAAAAPVGAGWGPAHAALPVDPALSHAGAPMSRVRRLGVLVAAGILLMLAAAVAAFLAYPHIVHHTAAPAKPAAAAASLEYVTYTDPAGFTIKVPKDWRQIPQKNYVDFQEAPHGRFLRVIATRAGGHDVQALLQANDRDTQRTLSGYRLVSITTVQVAGRPAGDWEFTHTSGGNRHVVVRSLVVDDTWYSFYFSTREDQFASSKGILTAVADSLTLR